jgi:hypothetical protein
LFNRTEGDSNFGSADRQHRFDINYRFGDGHLVNVECP